MCIRDSTKRTNSSSKRLTLLRRLSTCLLYTSFRMNGLDTHFAYRDLVEIVEAAGDRIDLIVVPKVSRPEDVHFVDTLLGQIESYKGFSNRIGVEALIETAQGCVNIREIAASSERLQGFVYGPGDYAASVRMPLESIGELDENDKLYPGDVYKRQRQQRVMLHGVEQLERHGGQRIVGEEQDGQDAGQAQGEGDRHPHHQE